MLSDRRLAVIGQVVSILLVGVSGSALAAPTAPGAGGPATPATVTATAAAGGTGGASSASIGSGSVGVQRSASIGSGSVGVQRVDSCTRIDEPGVYVLGSNVTNATATEDTGIGVGNETVRACVLVASSDVFLAGDGHMVDGPGFDDVGGNDTLNASFDETERARYSLGIAVRGENGSALSNVTVTNVTTRDWFVGTFVENASNATVFEVDAEENANVGLELVGVENSIAVASSADRNGFAGLYASGTSNVSVVDSAFEGNDVVGVDAYFGNQGLVLVNASVSNSSVAGVAAVQSTGTVVAETTTRNVGGDDSVLGFSGSYVFLNASDAVVVESATRADGSWALYATDCENAPGACLNATPDAGGGAGTVTAEAFSVGNATVSFTGQNVAVGAVDALAANASNASTSSGLGLGAGVVVTNTSANAFVDLSTAWAGARPVAVSSTRFAVANGTPGVQTDNATVDVRDRTVFVEGTTWGNDACYTAELSSVRYDATADRLTVTVDSVPLNGSSDTACAQVITEVPYRAVVSLTGTPGDVEVVHVHDGQRTVVASTANESATGASNGTSTNESAGNETASVATIGA